ncbi:MAG: hypothetical protein ACTSYV_01475 [Candidatus Heimdallarchaeaceae archaeon]
MISFAIPAKMTGLRITIAPTLDPNNTGRAQKGERRFKREQAAAFTLTVDDCLAVLENFKALREDTYVNMREKNSNRKNKLSFVHFPKQNTPSYCVFEAAKDTGGRLTNSIRVSIYPAKNSNSINSMYVFNRTELLRFRLILEAVCKNLDFCAMLAECVKNTFKQINYKNNNNNGGGDNHDSNENQKNDETSNPSPPPPKSSSIEETDDFFESSSDNFVSDIDFL